MTNINYTDEICKLIANYLPLTGIELGKSIQAINVSFSSPKITLELSQIDYLFILEQIQKNNYSYTFTNFFIKNRITSIVKYTNNHLNYHYAYLNNHYAYLIKFEKPLLNGANSDIELRGFTDNHFNTTYEIIEKKDNYNIIISPLNKATIKDVVGDLGYYPALYGNGLNGAKIITNEGNNSISFQIETNLVSSISSINDLDLTIMPTLWYYQDNLLTMSFENFQKRLTDGENNDYLIIDTISLVGSGMRSKNNNSDAVYSTFDTKAFFERQYTVNLIYHLERSKDDAKNSTESGWDIVKKQVDMFSALTAILRRPLPSDKKMNCSSVTVTDDLVNKYIPFGSVTIIYQALFTIQYLPDSILDLSNDQVYKINQINYSENYN